MDMGADLGRDMPPDVIKPYGIEQLCAEAFVSERENCRNDSGILGGLQMKSIAELKDLVEAIDRIQTNPQSQGIINQNILYVLSEILERLTEDKEAEVNHD